MPPAVRSARVLLAAAVLALAACGAPPSATDGDAGGDVTPDAGGGSTFDAGQPAPDAGTPPDDAGLSDAGPVDSGVPDAGSVTPDSGTPVPDAGLPLSDGGLLHGALVGGGGAWPGTISGVRWESAAGSGSTDDAGTFAYLAGGTVTFSVADVELGTTRGAPMVAPWQWLDAGCAGGPTFDKALTLVLSLDDDADPTTGTHLPAFTLNTPRTPIAAMSMADVAAKVAALIPGRTALTAAQANDRYARQVDDETWAELAQKETFGATVAIYRGQGCASDGAHWYFSGAVLTGTVEKTAPDFTSQGNVSIPLTQYLTDKSDHIGDIDVWNGHVYAPLEDGKNGYKNPRVALIDTATMQFGAVTAVPWALQTAGVPWVAVDAPRGYLYMAEWGSTTQLNRFRLTDLTYVDSLPLQLPPGTTLGRIQGAKVSEGALYFATDEATKSIGKINLETGTVLRLFAITGGGEQEGLCFQPRPDGSTLHTLNITTSSVSSELRHHQRVRAPLRRQLCP